VSGQQLVTFVAQSVRMAIPYTCAALGGVWSERSGVVNIALEGMLLAGGLAAVVAEHATGSAVAGVVAAMGVAAAMGLAHALTFVVARVDAIVSGIALNLIAAGGTRFALRALYDSSSNSPSVSGFASTWLKGSGGAALLLRTLLDPATLLTAALVAWTVGSAICGLGGAALAFDQHQFQAGMSGGRGFIALAAVIVSGWRPGRAVAACLVFAALDTAQIAVQDSAGELRDLVQMVPYVATLGALAWIASRRVGSAGSAPAGLGRHA
jgi:simple sugar transport system permease protein